MYLLYSHISSSASSLRRWGARGNRVQIACPQAIVDYFYKSRSVDVIGQLHYCYLIGRKSKRPYSRLVWWLIDMCIVNAYTLYKIHITQLAFRQQLMHELVNLFGANRNAIQVSRGANVAVALAKDHYSIVSNVARDCVVCSPADGKRVKPVYICSACNVHLCVGECFARYHSRV